MRDQAPEPIGEVSLTLAEQSIVNLSTSEPLMDELLLRVAEPAGPPGSPVDFLRRAEARGAVGRVDRWVLKHAVEIAATGRRVSVNVSAHTIGDGEYDRCVAQLLSESGADPTLLTFEITETAPMPDCREAALAAAALHGLGCKIALDDFGTGYASLTYLKRFPVQYVKIDREFIRDLTTNESSATIVKGLVTLAHGLGKETIAEGIETDVTLAAVREIGVDFGQGHLIGRPRAVSQPSGQPIVQVITATDGYREIPACCGDLLQAA